VGDYMPLVTIDGGRNRRSQVEQKETPMKRIMPYEIAMIVAAVTLGSVVISTDALAQRAGGHMGAGIGGGRFGSSTAPVGHLPGSNPANPQDLSGGSNPQDRSGNANPQDMRQPPAPPASNM
jgi:hypothetical protein